MRRHPGLRERFNQVPQDDPLSLFDVFPEPLHGEHLRTPHRLSQGHQNPGDQSHSGLHVQGRGQRGSRRVTR